MIIISQGCRRESILPFPAWLLSKPVKQSENKRLLKILFFEEIELWKKQSNSTSKHSIQLKRWLPTAWLLYNIKFLLFSTELQF